MDPQSMGSQGSNVSSGGKLRLLSDCVAGKTVSILDVCTCHLVHVHYAGYQLKW